LTDRVRDWLHTHDPGNLALRRAVRAAILMPAMFAIGDKVIANPEIAYFVAFGSFAMLLLVDFQGSIADRVLAQASLGIGCVVMITLGTLVSQSTAAATIAMALVAFVILFSGCVSSVLASATTALLLAFILPVSLPGSASAIPDRVAGWGLAAGVSLFAISLLWPAPERNPVRTNAIAACRALGARLRAEITYLLSDGSEADREPYVDTVTAANAAVDGLHSVFFGSPYRPTGLTTDARAVVRLVDELRWLNSIVLRSAPKRHIKNPNRSVCAVKAAAAEVLEQAAALLDAPGSPADELAAARERMRAALVELEQATTKKLPSPEELPAPGDDRAKMLVTALDPSFRAQELSFIVGQIATNIGYAAAAARRSWLDRLLGRQPAGFTGTFEAAEQRLSAHVQPSSSWLHNSLRGAAALSLAVLVADLSSVQHAFWVVFGTLAVLRSNALSTGQNALRALGGTTAGFIVGGAIVYAIGTNTTLLWVLLPFVVLFAGLAPAAISFAAGQAAFTITLLILFNLLVPAGWQIGLLRIEDVAIGCAVSLVVGVLFWPRGAAAAFGRALSQAYTDSIDYLAGAVAYGVGRCDQGGPQSPAPREQALRAAAAARRLDDTFRGYLTERGSKPVPLSEVTSLVTGVVGVRLAGDAVLELWERGGVHGGDRSGARAELLSAAANVSGWYSHFASGLTGDEGVPDPLVADEAADGRLVAAVANDLGDPEGHATETGVRVIWTGDHIDAVRRLQEMLVEPARAAVADHALGPRDELLREGLAPFRASVRTPASA
jgi:Fusaric acid resistance protein-like